ncbi:DUF917 domain-containing protein [Sediminivirga luteola]|uniref:DUF917 domain-containing protein n=1 Tax=Sediminivirga luteola TaxID=1774748 RepID=A0A8J2TZN6_9MICO|nr:DUF917 domain-containing protein [Sediminivirga luteola]GGA21755.1 hypothetical protein GCM10011333_26000 [Sediminivirga luteola]
MTRILTVEDIDDIAIGAGILGTGGGGDPLIGRLLVQKAIRDGLTVTVVHPDEVPDEACVIASAMMGAPTVVVEKLPAGEEALNSLRALETRIGKTADFIIPMEIGGLNSMIPLLAAAQAGIPVVDGDGMGRAFPELQMETFGVYGVPGSPLVVSDANGDHVVVETGDDNVRMESFARAVTIRMGGAAYIAEYPMSGADVKRTAVAGTLGLAQSFGAAVREANQAHSDPIAAIASVVQDSIYGYAHVIATGKVTDVQRQVVDGFSSGTLKIAVFGAEDELVIDFRNENIIARMVDPAGHSEVVGVVPDLICVLDSDSGEAITTESTRYGQRVTVLGISTPEIMRTPEALKVWGPRCFGLDHDWTPLEQLAAPKQAAPAP